MNLAEASAFVTTFKGAALSCLILMWSMRESQSNWNRNDLATLTGWSRENVAQGLQRLALHGLAIRANYEAWQLTDKGYQFSFADLGKLLDKQGEPLRVEKIDSQRRSSSLLIDHEVNHDHGHIQQQPLALRVENIDSQHSQIAFDWLTDLLIKKCGAPPQNARAAISQALEAGAEPVTIVEDTLKWLAYCRSNEGKGLTPGIFIPARIGQGVAPPDYYEPPASTTWEIQRLRAELPED